MMELYDQALHLPVKWHQDHHSGVIISRIRKAYEALKDFFQNGFMYIHALAKFVMSFVAMIYFTPLFGGIGLILGAVIVAVIFRFDRPLIQYLHETNEQEHKVSASLFDSLSNINTVITLRLEPQMKKFVRCHSAGMASISQKRDHQRMEMVCGRHARRRYLCHYHHGLYLSTV